MSRDDDDQQSAGSNQAPDSHPSPAKIAEWLARALAWQRRGHLVEARTLCQRVLAVQPDHPEALNLLGILLWRQGQWVQAEQSIRRAIHSGPGYAAAYVNLAKLLIGRKRHEEAIAVFQQAIRIRPDQVEAGVELGALLGELGRLPEAVDAYRRASARCPADAEVHYRLGVLLAELGQNAEAITALETAYQGNPDHDEAIVLLVTLLQRQGRTEAARNIVGNVVFQRGGAKGALTLLQHWLRLMPDDPVAQHRLAAWFGKEAPARASDAYVTDLFDRYAASFDQHLVGQLDYQAPAVIGAWLTEILGEATARLDVLDAGCGTGLCALMLRPYARRLTGVDLSLRMVEKARARGEYDELAVTELTAFLNERPGAYDLIVSADTLVYFGALETVSRAAAAALRPGGWLAFTAEQTTADAAPDGYCLNQSGRYSHTAEYLERVLVGVGLELRTRADATLRQDGDQAVVGHVALARKPVAAID
ncbi:MAG: tetratricopeptide repeat protein [Candidatus Contendobacter sp.]